MRTKMLGLCLVGLLATACGGGSAESEPSAISPSSALPSSALPSSASLSCDAVFTEGAILPKDLSEGCTNAQGNIYIPGTFDCTDGRQLLSDERGWGYLGEAVHAKRAETDPAFAKEYDSCH
jgi:hypothetical protein